MDKYRLHALDVAVKRSRFQEGGVVQDSDFFELLDEHGQRLHPRTQTVDWIVKVVKAEFEAVTRHWGMR